MNAQPLCTSVAR